MPILFLVGLLQADELEKSEVNKVYVMKDKTIIFELKDDSYLKGNVLTSDCLRGKIYFENKDDFEDTPNYLPSNSGYWEEWLVDLGIIEDNYSDEED